MYGDVPPVNNSPPSASSPKAQLSVGPPGSRWILGFFEGRHPGHFARHQGRYVTLSEVMMVDGVPKESLEDASIEAYERLESSNYVLS